MLNAILNLFKPYKKEEPAMEVSTANTGIVYTVAATEMPSTISLAEEPKPVAEAKPVKAAPKADKPKKAKPTTKKPAKITAGASKTRKKK